MTRQSKMLSPQRLNHLRRVARYAIVGATQNAIFYALSLGLLFLGWRAWQALAVLYPVAVALSFIANRDWTFNDRQRPPGQLARYVACYCITYPTALLLVAALEYGGTPAWLASLITLLVAAVGLWLAMNLWVFPKPRAAVEGAAT